MRFSVSKHLIPVGPSHFVQPARPKLVLKALTTRAKYLDTEDHNGHKRFSLSRFVRFDDPSLPSPLCGCP